MDEMLKTWKEPVPGALDTRPVFPREVTSPIENALIKARTSAIQAHQEHTRSQQQVMGRGRPLPASYPNRDTPTPPTTYRQPPPPVQQGYSSNYPQQQQYAPPMNGPHYGQQPNPIQQYGLPPVRTHSPFRYDNADWLQRPPVQHYPQHNASASAWSQPLPPQGYSAPDNSIDVLNSDIANLITVSKADFAQNPLDGDIQKRLKALLDLQSILQSQKLPPDQIALIKTQVAQLSEASKAAPKVAPKPPTRVPAPAQPLQPNSLSSLLGPGALAALMARQSATPQPTLPGHAQIRSPQPAPSQPFTPPAAAPATSTPVPDPNSLLGRLRAAGLISGASAASTPTPLSSVPANVTGYPPPFATPPPAQSRTQLGEIPNDVVLKTNSLKMYVILSILRTKLTLTALGHILSPVSMRSSVHHVRSVADAFSLMKRAERRRQLIWIGTSKFISE